MKSGYWVLVCNPRKWAVDRFLETGQTRDTWGINQWHKDDFQPGQLALLRVGVDRRTRAQLDGAERLEAGIYALCLIESEAFEGYGSENDFWYPEEVEDDKPRPTVHIRYLQSYLDRPLTIERLRTERPDLSRNLLEGLQTSSFPIPREDFETVLAMLGESYPPPPMPLDDVPATLDLDRLDELDRRYRDAAPTVKEVVSQRIERGSIGDMVKQRNGYRCQICDRLGLNPVAFLKRDGNPYVEAHHVVPVSEQQVGSLSASNVITVCPNHHRQLHYGDVQIEVTDTTFEIRLDGETVSVERFSPSR